MHEKYGTRGYKHGGLGGRPVPQLDENQIRKLYKGEVLEPETDDEKFFFSRYMKRIRNAKKATVTEDRFNMVSEERLHKDDYVNAIWGWCRRNIGQMDSSVARAEISKQFDLGMGELSEEIIRLNERINQQRQSELKLATVSEDRRKQIVQLKTDLRMQKKETEKQKDRANRNIKIRRAAGVK